MKRRDRIVLLLSVGVTALSIFSFLFVLSTSVSSYHGIEHVTERMPAARVSPASYFNIAHQLHYSAVPTNTTSQVYMFGNVEPKVSVQSKMHLLPGQTYVFALPNYSRVASSDMDKYRSNSPSQIPRQCTQDNKVPWLIEFRGVWMNNKGEILVPERLTSNGTAVARHYAFTGGQSSQVNVVPQRTKSLFPSRHSKCRHKLAFSLAQYNGETYYHVLDDVLPRFFSFKQAADAVLSDHGLLVEPGIGKVVRPFLELFGIPSNKVTTLREMCYFDRLLVPEPLRVGTYAHACHRNATSHVLRDHFLRNVIVPSRPVVLFLDRAHARPNSTHCRGMRCVANLPELIRAAKFDLGESVQVQTFRGEDSATFGKGARMFHRATVVLGIHGAGFANIFYMRGAGTSVIEFAREEDPIMYPQMAQSHGVDYRFVLTLRKTHWSSNIMVDTPVVILEIRRALTRVGFKLPPPRISTNASRNAEVVRQYVSRGKATPPWYTWKGGPWVNDGV